MSEPGWKMDKGFSWHFEWLRAERRRSKRDEEANG